LRAMGSKTREEYKPLELPCVAAYTYGGRGRFGGSILCRRAHKIYPARIYAVQAQWALGTGSMVRRRRRHNIQDVTSESSLQHTA
jgi:hypothetical protein